MPPATSSRCHDLFTFLRSRHRDGEAATESLLGPRLSDPIRVSHAHVHWNVVDERLRRRIPFPSAKLTASVPIVTLRLPTCFLSRVRSLTRGDSITCIAAGGLPGDQFAWSLGLRSPGKAVWCAVRNLRRPGSRDWCCKTRPPPGQRPSPSGRGSEHAGRCGGRRVDLGRWHCRYNRTARTTAEPFSLIASSQATSRSGRFAVLAAISTDLSAARDERQLLTAARAAAIELAAARSIVNQLAQSDSMPGRGHHAGLAKPSPGQFADSGPPQDRMEIPARPRPPWSARSFHPRCCDKEVGEARFDPSLP